MLLFLHEGTRVYSVIEEPGILAKGFGLQFQSHIRLINGLQQIQLNIEHSHIAIDRTQSALIDDHPRFIPTFADRIRQLGVGLKLG